ncbi:MAG: SDR family oxidoreductase, partial [Chloroflexi bacterium]|nr:SDR family oxidoreductase [Chloroflexota bacterium]
ITFSSMAGLWGSSGQANYGAAKSGIGGLTKVVARDVGRYGVTANAIVPMAATRMTTSVPQAAQAARASGGIALGTPEGATETDFDPDDIAPFVAYLASDFAAGVNGQFFFVYGKSVSLMSQPRLERTVLKPEGFWSVEELIELLPRTIAKDLPNPAPAASAT